MSVSLYDLLGVGPDATLSELRASYKRRMLEVHPDKGGNVELCQRVVAAFEHLADPEARRRYDARVAKHDLPRSRTKRSRRSSPCVARSADFRSMPEARATDQANPNNTGADRDSAPKHDPAPTNSYPGCNGEKSCGAAASGISQTQAPPGAGIGASSARCNSSFKAGRTRNSSSAPSPRNLKFVIRVVRLLRRLPRDARRDFLSQGLSEAQRKAIEAFMLSEAQAANSSRGASGECDKDESIRCISSPSSDESLDSQDGYCDDEDKLFLKLCDETDNAKRTLSEPLFIEQGRRCDINGECGNHEPSSCDARSIQLHAGIQDDRVRPWVDEAETQGEEDSDEEASFVGGGGIGEKNNGDMIIGRNVAQDEKDVENAVGEGKAKHGEESEKDDEDQARQKGCNRATDREDCVNEGTGNMTPRAAAGRRRGRGIAQVRGIYQEVLRGCTFYTAKVTFDWLSLRGRRRRRLAQALDDHIVLIAIKTRALFLSSDLQIESLAFPRAFEEKLGAAILDVLKENGLTWSNFGFDLHVSVPAYHWVGRALSSPVYTMTDLKTGLNMWRRFREARGQYGVGGAGLLFRCSPGEATQIWQRVRELYSAIWAQRGWDADVVLTKLDAMEAEFAHRRWRQLERWERTRMDREERFQRVIIRVAVCADAHARRVERFERVAMRKEDQLSWNRKRERQHLSVRSRLSRLASVWLRELKKVERNQEAMQARDARRSAIARHREEQARLVRHSRLMQVQSERRWRWMHRKDLTMEQILRGWPSDQ
eukprot:TRINITY_DN19804_c2_g1_i1.p1 TRINITY_DN19804_c2_g1~~TRINITY_DN19804_c2_g1_i1.p1  ORF type:complete len:770 (-),score=88.28 TRINITY_DN19804_c2_g1_i1:183-2492(-)